MIIPFLPTDPSLINCFSPESSVHTPDWQPHHQISSDLTSSFSNPILKSVNTLKKSRIESSYNFSNDPTQHIYHELEVI